MKKVSLLLIVFILPIFTVSASCKKETNRSFYEITCELDGNVLTAEEKVEFYNHSENAFKGIKFNLYANAFREGAKYSPISPQYTSKAYYNGLNYGNIEILKVYNEKGQALNFSVVGEDFNVLEVELLDEVFPEERTVINIEYRLNLANVIARTGITEKSVNLANFYPILCAIEDGAFYECVYYANGDPFFSDVADYVVNFTCSEEYVIASSGKIQKSVNKNGKVTNTYQIDNARSFALTLSKEFESLSERVNGTEILYYYYQDETPEKSLEYAKKSMEYFTKTIGEYPYETYSVVQTEFVQGGMEFPALVMISDDLEPLAYGEVIVHETAHQWWQTVVGNNEIKYGFLDEGLAEYFVVLFYENHPEYGFDRETLITSSEKTYKTFCSVYDKIYGKVNTSMLRSLSDFSSEYEYVNIAYVKPCVMYDNLRKTIGDEKFFKCIKNYYKNYSFTNASPDCLVSEFEKQVGGVSGFFNSFFEGKAII